VAIFPVVFSAESAAPVGLDDEDEGDDDDNDESEEDEGEVIGVLRTFVAVEVAVDAVVVVDDCSVMLKYDETKPPSSSGLIHRKNTLE
jgi:hypothetical protein